MVGYDIVLGRVTYSYGWNSPGTYNWDVAGYINEYGETYSSTSVNNSDYDSCGCIYITKKKSTSHSPIVSYSNVTSAFRVDSNGDVGGYNWSIDNSYGK